MRLIFISLVCFLLSFLFFVFASINIAQAQYTVIFTVTSAEIDKAEEEKLKTRKMKGRMTKTEERGGRSLYEIMVKDLKELPEAALAFSTREPEILAVHNLDGSPYGYRWAFDPETSVRQLIREIDPVTGQPVIIPFKFKKQKYLDSLPDKLINCKENGDCAKVRRTEPEQVHKFFGTGDKVFME